MSFRLSVTKWYYTDFCYSDCHYGNCGYTDFHYADCHYANYFNVVCHYGDCLCADCLDADWHYTDSCYGDYHSADCHYADCHYVDCHGTIQNGTDQKNVSSDIEKKLALRLIYTSDLKVRFFSAYYAIQKRDGKRDILKH
jgi:hypothetical protein